MLSAAKIDDSSSLILGKRKAFEDASKSFPMMKPMGERKNNNKRGYWGRDERFLNKNKIKNKKMNKKNKKTQNLQSKPSLVLATPPKLERDFKRQVVEVFEYFGIGKTLSDRLKNNMFFRSRSPSKMKTTRIKDLKAIATAKRDHYQGFRKCILVSTNIAAMESSNPLYSMRILFQIIRGKL